MINLSLLPAVQSGGRPRAGRRRTTRRRVVPPFLLRTALIETGTEAAGLVDPSVRPDEPAVPGEAPSAGPADEVVTLVSIEGAPPRGHDGRPGGDGRGGAAAHDAGMSTVEYAVGTVVAAAFAAVLYKIVTGDSVVTGLTSLIDTALSSTF